MKPYARYFARDVRERPNLSGSAPADARVAARATTMDRAAVCRECNAAPSKWCRLDKHPIEDRRMGRPKDPRTTSGEVRNLGAIIGALSLFLREMAR